MVIAAGGPLVQIRAVQRGLQQLGSVVALDIESFPDKRIYLGVSYPNKNTDINFSLVEDTLIQCLEQAEASNHKNVTVAFFYDAPEADAAKLLPLAAAATLHACTFFEGLEITVMAWTDRQFEVLNDIVSNYLRETKAKETTLGETIDEIDEKPKARGRRPSTTKP